MLKIISNANINKNTDNNNDLSLFFTKINKWWLIRLQSMILNK